MDLARTATENDIQNGEHCSHHCQCKALKRCVPQGARYGITQHNEIRLTRPTKVAVGDFESRWDMAEERRHVRLCAPLIADRAGRIGDLTVSQVIVLDALVSDSVFFVHFCTRRIVSWLRRARKFLAMEFLLR
jgi:hypothetical protein